MTVSGILVRPALPLVGETESQLPPVVVLALALGTASTSIWTLFGSALRPFLTSDRAVRAFNIVMALLLLASLIPVLLEA